MVYVDLIYIHFSATTLRSVDALCHAVFRFTAGNGFRRHHCLLYKKVGWQLLAVGGELHSILCIFLANYSSILHVLLNIDQAFTVLGPKIIQSLKIVILILGLGNWLLNFMQEWNNLQKHEDENPFCSV